MMEIGVLVGLAGAEECSDATRKSSLVRWAPGHTGVLTVTTCAVKGRLPVYIRDGTTGSRR